MQTKTFLTVYSYYIYTNEKTAHAHISVCEPADRKTPLTPIYSALCDHHRPSFEPLHALSSNDVCSEYAEYRSQCPPGVKTGHSGSYPGRSPQGLPSARPSHQHSDSHPAPVMAQPSRPNRAPTYLILPSHGLTKPPPTSSYPSHDPTEPHLALPVLVMVQQSPQLPRPATVMTQQSLTYRSTEPHSSFCTSHGATKPHPPTSTPSCPSHAPTELHIPRPAPFMDQHSPHLPPSAPIMAQQSPTYLVVLQSWANRAPPTSFCPSHGPTDPDLPRSAPIMAQQSIT